jgi:putative ATP-dependent endonuclease of OLD family
MQIANIQIRNFRGIKSGSIDFAKHSVLIGPNNCGKTTIIEALALLVGRDKLVRSLTEHDFYASNPKPTDRIHIIATVTGFYTNKPEENSDWFGDGRAIPKWHDTATGKLHPAQSTTDLQLACQIAFCARFDFKDLEVETIRYFYDDDHMDDVFDDEQYVNVYGKLLRDLGFFLVPASRSWDKIISFGSELFKKVISSGGGPPAESIVSLRDKLRMPESPLEDDPNLASLIGDINDELSSLFSSQPRLKLRITSTDSEGILDAVIPHFSVAECDYSIPSRRHGNGLVSLQWLLLLLQFGRQRAKLKENFIMALEEPELHIPPSVQIKLVHRIQALSSQTFITTHSPAIAGVSDPLSLIILRNENGMLTGKRLLEKPLLDSTPNAIRKLFQLNRSETVSALMFDILLIPEGRIDYDLLNLLIKSVDMRQDWQVTATTNFGALIGIIPTHDAAIKNTFQAVSHLHPHICCLVDGDTEGLRYITDVQSLTGGKKANFLRWPDGQTIEDGIGWVLLADETAAIGLLQKASPLFPNSVKELVEKLKSTDRANGGLKQDRNVYETVAEIVYELRPCLSRANLLLDGMIMAMNGKTSKNFLQSDDDQHVFIFQP